MQLLIKLVRLYFFVQQFSELITLLLTFQRRALLSHGRSEPAKQINIYALPRKHVSIFSRNSEAITSKFLENLEIFSRC